MEKEPVKAQCGICDFTTEDSNEMVRHFLLKHPEKVGISVLDDIKNSPEKQDHYKIRFDKDGNLIDAE